MDALGIRMVDVALVQVTVPELICKALNLGT